MGLRKHQILAGLAHFLTATRGKNEINLPFYPNQMWLSAYYFHVNTIFSYHQYNRIICCYFSPPLVQKAGG
jgi:hypothetical protein